MERIEIPTGYIIIDEYSRGKLETLSIGDYGKSKNIKAPFLGFNDDINGVPNGPVLPLSQKWVVTISTQYGCSMTCKFCDVPSVGFHGNASSIDMMKQIYNALACFPDVIYTDRLNIHFARMGEPTFNEDVFTVCNSIQDNKQGFQLLTGIRFEVIHPVVSTMCPNKKSLDFVHRWVQLKNQQYHGQAGLQISVNSTDEAQRRDMFSNRGLSLEEIAEGLQDLPDPIGRKYCLNFAFASGYEVNGEKLAKLFSPEKWMAKITPIHQTTACSQHDIQTVDGYKSFTPYKEAEASLIAAGFNTIVFIPSFDEEDGCVTCGNAILGQSQLRA